MDRAIATRAAPSMTHDRGFHMNDLQMNHADSTGNKRDKKMPSAIAKKNRLDKPPREAAT